MATFARHSPYLQFRRSFWRPDPMLGWEFLDNPEAHWGVDDDTPTRPPLYNRNICNFQEILTLAQDEAVVTGRSWGERVSGINSKELGTGLRYVVEVLRKHHFPFKLFSRIWGVEHYKGIQPLYTAKDVNDRATGRSRGGSNNKLEGTPWDRALQERYKEVEWHDLDVLNKKVGKPVLSPHLPAPPEGFVWKRSQGRPSKSGPQVRLCAIHEFPRKNCNST